MQHNINHSMANDEVNNNAPVKKKMSPRTAEKVKQLAMKKVWRMRTDIIKDDDDESMEKLSKMLIMMR